MENKVTLVTAFFDINRAELGDGRTIEEYKEWIKKTLQLNCNLFIVTEPKFHKFFTENRPPEYMTAIMVINFSESYYYRYYNVIKTIIESDEYKKRIAFPNRVECILPEYNIIQYSKFHYLNMAIETNPFNSDFFFWIDAGCSRFFLDVDITRPYPSPDFCHMFSKYENKFLIQKRDDFESYPMDDNFVWKADNLLCGTMFGGNKLVIRVISQLIEHIFIEKMIYNSNVNNEQLALAMVCKQYPDLFLLMHNLPGIHLYMFKKLSI